LGTQAMGLHLLGINIDYQTSHITTERCWSSNAWDIHKHGSYFRNSHGLKFCYRMLVRVENQLADWQGTTIKANHHWRYSTGRQESHGPRNLHTDFSRCLGHIRSRIEG